MYNIVLETGWYEDRTYKGFFYLQETDNSMEEIKQPSK